MTKGQALKYFRTQAALGAALGIGQTTVSMWGQYPPALRQIQIERLTKGKLKAEPSCYNPKATETA